MMFRLQVTIAVNHGYLMNINEEIAPSNFACIHLVTTHCLLSPRGHLTRIDHNLIIFSILITQITLANDKLCQNIMKVTSDYKYHNITTPLVYSVFICAA